MKSFFTFHRRIADIRYKAYRLGTRIALGDLCGHALGNKLCRNLDECSAQTSISKHMLERKQIAEAYIQRYPFPEEFPLYFPRTEAFSDRSVYLLSNSVVSPHTGAMWFEKQALLQQSLGSVPRIFGWGGVKETLLPIKNSPSSEPICPLANAGYYHVLMESIPQALHAIDCYPKTKLLIPTKPRKHLASILGFLGLLNDSRVIRSDYPLRAYKAVLVPRWVNGGFVPQEDVDILRQHILSKLPTPEKPPTRRIYISRSKCPHRALSNEKELEKELEKNGFEILFFEEMPFTQQMTTVDEAEIIVAPHGSGLANIIAGSSGLKIIEIISPNWFNTCYAKLAVQCGFKYQYVTTEPDGTNSYRIPIDLVVGQIHESTLSPTPCL